ncbi:MAG TPA: DUF1501 domain-containing protein [Acidimicrobiales bacterium]|nr:DUF1501 domain-containing protein [Acidimicrobiales bacterium]
MSPCDFNRRQFLQYTGAAGAATVAATLSMDEVAQAASATPLPVGTPILVIVTLYGGNDGLNTVVPYLDPAYFSNRPGMSFTAADVIPLSDGLSLNGTMTGFASLWAANKLAIVLGTSYPNPNLSHFSSMAIWQSASPVEEISSGWIGRYLDALPHDPFRAIGIDSTLTPLLAGVNRVGSMVPISGLQLPWGSLATQLELLAGTSRQDTKLVADAAGSIADLYALSATLSPVLKTAPPTSASPLAQQLDVVADMITANVPTRVYSVSLSGFDTHAAELSQQNALVGQVSDAITAFLTQIGTTPRADDVVVMVYSEFGRRVQANGGEGTDHGTSAPVFVAGNRVAGGFYGEQPSLTQLVQGDLAVVVDFRDVYASMLEDVLGVDAGKILNNWSTKLDLITPAA